MLTAIAPLVLLLGAGAPPERPADVGKGLEPSPTPVAWEFEFKFLDPQRIEVAGPGGRETYWYIVYTVVNKSPQSQRFFPLFQIVTEDLKVYDTDMGISPAVFDAIASRHKITHKYLVPPTKAIGALLTGDDNARESVAVWRDIDLTVNNFKVYVAGLSGEIRNVPNRQYDPKAPETRKVAEADGRERELPVNPRVFTLRKTLQIQYTLPGSPLARPGVAPERGDIRWIMR